MDVSKVLRSSFIAGVVVLAPLIVTVFTIRFLANWLAGFIDPLVVGTRLASYTANIELVAQALAVLLILAVIVLVGYVAQHRPGQRAIDWVDRGIGFVPLVRVIYAGVREVSNALLERQNRYESVVLVEYPRREVYCLGFVTGDTPSTLSDAVGESLFNVFLPNSPNPTGGRLVMVPESQVHRVDISVRQGLGLVMTTGITEDEDPLEDYLTDVDGDPTLRESP